ncbi:hypothetical protein AAHC03_01833 [Spirometra sp. Aus1]
MDASLLEAQLTFVSQANTELFNKYHVNKAIFSSLKLQQTGINQFFRHLYYFPGGMNATLKVDPFSASSKARHAHQKTTSDVLEVRGGFCSRITQTLLKISYLIGSFVTVSQFIENSANYGAENHNLYQLCLWSSWLFLGIGFCIRLCGVLCLFGCLYSDVIPAAVDAFLYGVLLGNLAVLQSFQNEDSLVDPLKVLVFGLAGLLLVHIDSALSAKEGMTYNLVLVI